MTKHCSLNYDFSTRKSQAQNMLCTQNEARFFWVSNMERNHPHDFLSQSFQVEPAGQWGYTEQTTCQKAVNLSTSSKAPYHEKSDFNKLTVRATVVYTDPERAIWVIGTRNGAKCGKTYTVDFEREEKICMRIKWVDIYEMNLLRKYDGH